MSENQPAVGCPVCAAATELGRGDVHRAATRPYTPEAFVRHVQGRHHEAARRAIHLGND